MSDLSVLDLERLRTGDCDRNRFVMLVAEAPSAGRGLLRKVLENATLLVRLAKCECRRLARQHWKEASPGSCRLFAIRSCRSSELGGRSYSCAAVGIADSIIDFFYRGRLRKFRTLPLVGKLAIRLLNSLFGRTVARCFSSRLLCQSYRTRGCNILRTEVQTEGTYVARETQGSRAN